VSRSRRWLSCAAPLPFIYHLDEAQNTTVVQMKLFLTAWLDSQAVITGDIRKLTCRARSLGPDHVHPFCATSQYRLPLFRRAPMWCAHELFN
jgi:hypothetical protein